MNMFFIKISLELFRIKKILARQQAIIWTDDV